MIRSDAKANGLGLGGFLKSCLVPDSFNAVVWIRIYQAFERWGVPTFIPYRYLYHIHGLEYARNVRVGAGLRIPHPRGLLFTKNMRIGSRCSIYGNVRFTRSYDEVPVVGNDVLIGDSVIFTGKAKVGDNTIVGAGSVVTRAFHGNAIIAGNPARVIRKKDP